MTLRTGDHIKVPGRLGVDHHGIVDRRGGGGLKVIHASKTAGAVVVSSLREFSGGRQVGVVARASKGERFEVADRARLRLSERYDLLGANCEHLAYGASYDEESSPQLRTALCVGAVAIGVVLLAKALT